MNNDVSDDVKHDSNHLSRLFKLHQHGTDVRTETIAGMTTFLTMVYIVFVNPQILGAAQMDPKVVFVTTCLIAGIGSIAMGLVANLPVALAPAMGLNAFFAFVVVGAMGVSWQTGMGAIFWGAVGLFLLTLFRIRSGDPVIGINPGQLPFRILLDKLRIMCHLHLITGCLLLTVRGNPAVSSDFQLWSLFHCGCVSHTLSGWDHGNIPTYFHPHPPRSQSNCMHTPPVQRDRQKPFSLQAW